MPGEPQEAAGQRTPEEAAVWEKIIEDFEREAKAIGNEPAAARLYLEIGRVWEEQLSKPRNAAMAYQRAFNLDPRDPAIVHAAAVFYVQRGDWERARTYAQQLVALAPGAPGPTEMLQHIEAELSAEGGAARP